MRFSMNIMDEIPVNMILIHKWSNECVDNAIMMTNMSPTQARHLKKSYRNSEDKFLIIKDFNDKTYSLLFDYESLSQEHLTRIAYDFTTKIHLSLPESDFKNVLAEISKHIYNQWMKWTELMITDSFIQIEE